MKFFCWVCSKICVLMGLILFVYSNGIDTVVVGCLVLCVGMSFNAGVVGLQNADVDELTDALNETKEILKDLDIKVHVLNAKHGLIYHEDGYIEHTKPKSDEMHSR